jgi:hypothetical protein
MLPHDSDKDRPGEAKPSGTGADAAPSDPQVPASAPQGADAPSGGAEEAMPAPHELTGDDVGALVGRAQEGDSDALNQLFTR